MYNRYIRNDQGEYSRVSQTETTSSLPPKSEADHTHSTQNPPPAGQRSPVDSANTQRQTESPAELRWLNRLLGKLRLHDINAGDLLLLILLFILFHEDGDEELLIAIGLLLIM